MIQSQWTELVRTALSELGGDHILVPGAKLKQRLVARSDDPSALDSYLDAAGQRLSDLLEGIDGVQVKKRVGTDMLVGLEGALWPTGASQRAATRPEFRQDAYESLTRVTSSPYFYLSSTDEFRPSAEDHPDAIPLPLVTLPQLINQRRAFAESIADPSDQKRLIEALESSANPLGSFQRQVSEAGLGAQ